MDNDEYIAKEQEEGSRDDLAIFRVYDDSREVLASVWEGLETLYLGLERTGCLIGIHCCVSIDDETMCKECVTLLSLFKKCLSLILTKRDLLERMMLPMPKR